MKLQYADDITFITSLAALDAEMEIDYANLIRGGWFAGEPWKH